MTKAVIDFTAFFGILGYCGTYAKGVKYSGLDNSIDIGSRMFTSVAHCIRNDQIFEVCRSTTPCRNVHPFYYEIRIRDEVIHQYMTAESVILHLVALLDDNYVRFGKSANSKSGEQHDGDSKEAAPILHYEQDPRTRIYEAANR